MPIEEILKCIRTNSLDTFRFNKLTRKVFIRKFKTNRRNKLTIEECYREFNFKKYQKMKKD